MSSRSKRRRQHKRQARLARLSPEERRAEAARLLAIWRAEARSRARCLSAPTAWSLASAAVEARAMSLDPSGELLEELHGLITDAIVGAAGEPSMRTGKRSRRGSAASDEPANSPPRNLLDELLKETEGDD